MADAVVGLLRVLLTADTAQYESALKQAQSSAKAWSKDLKSIGDQATQLGGALSRTLTLPIVAVAGASVKAFADFDEAMTHSTAIMGNLSKEMRSNLEATAREVGKTTTFSAKQAADAFYFLASAGLSAAQSMGALPIVAKFATAGDFDLAEATSFLANAQSALGLKSEDTATHMKNMVRVSDVLVKANILADASTQQFSEALTNKAAAALRLVNKDLEEGAAVLAVYADQGVKGSEAGEKLNIVLRDLQTQAIKHKQAFKDLGVSVFDARGNMRNMADIVGDLEKALAGMSTEQRKATIMTLGFQDKSVSALNTLIGFSGQIRKFEADLRSAGGVTEEVAKKQLESFKAQLTLLWGKITDVGIALGKALVPAMQSLVSVVGGAVPFVEGLVHAFAALPGPLQAVVVLMGGLLAAAGPVLLIFGQLATAASAVTGAFAAKGIATRLLSGNLLGLAAAEGTATAATGLLGSVLAALPYVAVVAGLAAVGYGIYKVVTAESDLEKSLHANADAFKANTDKLASALDTYKALSEKQNRTKEETAQLDSATRTLATASGLSADAFKREEGASNTLSTALATQIRARKDLYVAATNQARSAAADAAQALADAQKQLNDVLNGKAITFDPAIGGGAPAARGLTSNERIQEAERLNGVIATLTKTSDEATAAFTHMAGVRPFKDTSLDAPAAAAGAAGVGAAAGAAGKDLAGLRAEIEGLRDNGNIAKLTEELRSGAFTVKQLSKEFGVSQEAIKLYQKELGGAAKAHKEAESAAEKHRKELEKLDAELAGKGIFTVTGYSAKLGNLVEILNAAATNGTPALKAAVKALAPEFTALAKAAEASGIAVGITEDIFNEFAEKAGMATLASRSLSAGILSVAPTLESNTNITREQSAELSAQVKAAAKLAEAYHDFGLKTREELTQVALVAERDYARIVAAVGKHAPEAKKAYTDMIEAQRAATGRLPTFWETNIFPRIKDVVGHIQTAVSGSFSQMLLGAKSFQDGFIDIWKSIKAGVLNILASIADAFLNSFLKGLLGALSGQRGAFGQAFAGLLGGGGSIGGGITDGLVQRGIGALLGGGGAAAGGSTGGLLGAGGASTTGGLLGNTTVGGSAAGGTTAGGGLMAGTSGVLLGGAAAAGSGVLLGLLGKQIFGGAGVKAGAFGAASGAATGALIGSVVPVLGTAIGALVGGIAGLISGWVGKTQKMKVNDARDQFIGQFGPQGTGKGSGFGNLADELHKLAGGEGLFQALIKAGNFKDYEAAVKNVVEALKSAEYATVKVREATDQLTQEREKLIASGEDEDAVIRQQAGSYSILLQTIQATGATAPKSLEPILQKLIDMGLLVDASGQKILNLAGVKFPAAADAITNEIKGIGEASNRTFDGITVDAMTAFQRARAAAIEAGRAIDSTFAGRHYSIPVEYDYRLSGETFGARIPSQIPGHASGGVFTSPHLARIAEGGQSEIVGSVDFMQKALEGALSRTSGTADSTAIIAHLRAIERAVLATRTVEIDGRAIVAASVRAIDGNDGASRTDMRRVLRVP